MILRKCEIKIDGNWVEDSFRNIKKDDIFRLFDPLEEGGYKPVEYEGVTEFIASCDSYDADGIYTVMVDNVRTEDIK